MKLLIGSLLVVSLLLMGCGGPSSLSGYDDLAKCLTAAGVKMYGANWCSHCQNQKAAFGDSFEKINYVECTKEQEACAAAGIEGLPTWVIDGQKYPGEQKLDRLAELADCS